MSPKKRSLLEMMDDSYLAELEDSRFAHSMESVGNLFEEVPTGDWEVKDRKTGKIRIPGTLLPRTPAQIASAARDAAERAKTKAEKAAAEAQAAVPADPPAAPEADPADGAPAAEAKPPAAPEAQADAPVKQDNDTSGRKIDVHDVPSVAGQIATAGDSDGEGGDDDTQADPDVNTPSGGLAYLDGLAQKEIDDASQTTDASKNATSESRLSLIDLLYDT